MATLDGYEPYATGMTAKMAVEALWRAYQIPEHSKEVLENSFMVISQNTPPEYSFLIDLDNVKFPVWHDLSTHKYYFGDINTTARCVIWFQIM